MLIQRAIFPLAIVTLMAWRVDPYAAQTMPASAPGTPSESSPAMSTGAASRPAVEAAAAEGGAGGDALAMFRAPLLREGSFLVEAPAHLVRDANRGEWKAVIDQHHPAAPGYELTVVPCTRLAEMLRIIESTPNQRVMFQMTGRVLVYRNRNYVLPTHAPIMVGHDEMRGVSAAPMPAKLPAKQAEASSNSEVATRPASMPAGPGENESAEAIASELERAAGPVMRSTTVPAEREAGESAGMAGSKRRESPSAGGAGPVQPERLMAENTSIASRRGKITRDGGGGWTFILDADANGLGDPPVRLLPCLLLEKIEEYARRLGNNSPALLSGPVFLFNGQNYLLPTVFRIPQDRHNLTP